MKQKCLAALIGVFALSTMAIAPAAAQNYVGLSWGLMSYEDGANELDSQGFTVFAGGQFDPLLSVEFAYTSLANAEINNQKNTASVTSISGVLRSPGEGFEPFLRLGLARGDANFQGDADDTYDKEKDGLVFGLGADFTLNYNATLRLEYVETDIDGANTDRLSFGSIYRF